MKTVIVGGVAGGASCGARLRRLDENAEIIIFEKGQYMSYANCGLPYYIGGEITNKKALTLQTPQSFKSRFNIDVRVLSEVVSIDRANKTVTVKNVTSGETYVESYDKLVLSPGAAPFMPPIGGEKSERVFTLRNIPDTYKIREFIDYEEPKTALVIGGGYIGVEMAENLAHAGLKVTIVELANHLIPPLDFDMAVDVHAYLKSKDIDVRLNEGAKSIEDFGAALNVELTNGFITADMVIMSVGVRPDTALAKGCDIAMNGRGSIIVNDNMETNDPDIYAVGDAVEVRNFVTSSPAFIPLAGPANKQGRIAADNICGIKSEYRGTQGSSVLKIFDMTAACTGLNEAAAQQAGINFEKCYTFSANHATYYPGAQNMSLKILFEVPSGRLIGAQAVGFDGVDKRIDVLATAIRCGMKAQDLHDLELCYAPPYSSAKDPVNMIGFAAQNLLFGSVKQYHWHDVQYLPRDGSVTLLDVRNPVEYAAGAIDGTIHIPLDELRDNLDKLEKGKKIFVNCQSGLRSYVACRMLSQHGFDCYNLSGGYRLYGAVTKDIAFDNAPVYPCGIKAI